ncbi:MAG: NAD-dependent epimerase/dehydratase family protein [Acidobacteria bacterium]|nr:NAD-dependent epimerase/dehydratase family protein [Acidobacteriota bacterium]
MRNCRILVTGATGFIGSHLCERLISEGAHVRCLVRPITSRGHRFLPPSGASPILGNLVSGSGLESAVEGVDIIFHLAGVTKALRAADYYAGNCQSTENLLRACERSYVRPRFIHISSLAAAGPSPNSTPVRESDEPHPVSDYGRSKLQAETAVRNSALASRATVVRPPVVYGPRDADVFEAFRAISRGYMVHIGSGESYFSFIHVWDLVDGLVQLAYLDSAGGRTYHLANPKPISWREFAEVSARIMMRGVKVLNVPLQAALLVGYCADFAARVRRRPNILSAEKVREAAHRYWTCDTSLAESELGYKPELSFREGATSTLAWYREEGWLNF